MSSTGPGMARDGQDRSGRIVLRRWALQGKTRRRSVEVLSDALGIEPIEFRVDGKPVLSIERPTVGRGRSFGACRFEEGDLIAYVDSVDAGAALEFEVYFGGVRLSDQDAAVEIPETRSETETRVRISARAKARSVALAEAAVIAVLVSGHSGRLGAVLIGAILFGADVLVIQAEFRVHSWIASSRWPAGRMRLADGVAVFSGLVLAICAAVLIFWAVRN